MLEIMGGLARFKGNVFPAQRKLFESLARDGQSPKTLMISCADSRVVPELITQSSPGELFVCRNAGNIVPPYATKNGGVSSTVEYAVMVLGVTDIIICGHSDCGAMKAFFTPEALATMPNVKAWLDHSQPAFEVVKTCHGHLPHGEKVKHMALENVRMQLIHLQNHPSVAARLASGKLRLHGWYFDIESGEVQALHPYRGFTPLSPDDELPVAVGARTPAPEAPRTVAERPPIERKVA
jgi:carbonic anhydrase